MGTLEEYLKTLKCYNPDEKCAVCGFDKIKDKFEPQGTPYEYYAVGVGGPYVGKKSYAAIRRTCLRCGNSWETWPLNKIDGNILGTSGDLEEKVKS